MTCTLRQNAFWHQGSRFEIATDVKVQQIPFRQGRGSKQAQSPIFTTFPRAEGTKSAVNVQTGNNPRFQSVNGELLPEKVRHIRFFLSDPAKSLEPRNQFVLRYRFALRKKSPLGAAKPAVTFN